MAFKRIEATVLLADQLVILKAVLDKAGEALAAHNKTHPQVQEQSAIAIRLWKKIGRTPPEGWWPKAWVVHQAKREVLLQEFEAANTAVLNQYGILMAQVKQQTKHEQALGPGKFGHSGKPVTKPAKPSAMELREANLLAKQPVMAEVQTAKPAAVQLFMLWNPTTKSYQRSGSALYPVRSHAAGQAELHAPIQLQEQPSSLPETQQGQLRKIQQALEDPVVPNNFQDPSHLPMPRAVQLPSGQPKQPLENGSHCQRRPPFADNDQPPVVAKDQPPKPKKPPDAESKPPVGMQRQPPLQPLRRQPLNTGQLSVDHPPKRKQLREQPPNQPPNGSKRQPPVAAKSRPPIGIKPPNAESQPLQLPAQLLWPPDPVHQPKDQPPVAQAPDLPPDPDPDPDLKINCQQHQLQ